MVAAYPGIASPSRTEAGEKIPDSFDTPLVADLNPIFVGIAGSRTYAGHWSETPDYANRRAALNKEIFNPTPHLKELGITHLVLPINGLKEQQPLETYGTVIFKGPELALIKL